MRQKKRAVDDRVRRRLLRVPKCACGNAASYGPYCLNCYHHPEYRASFPSGYNLPAAAARLKKARKR